GDVPPARKLNRAVTADVQRLLDELLAAHAEERTPTAASAVAQLDALIQAIDPEVGPRDVALMVGLHLAGAPVKTSAVPDALADLLAQELTLFSEAAASSGTALGA